MAVDAHLLLNLAALGAEAANRGAFLILTLAHWIRVKLGEAFLLLLLQFVGQVVEDAHTVLHRLQKSREYKLHCYLHIGIFKNSTL